MPYDNQYGSKTAHSDVVRNPEVQAFLAECRPIREPSDAEGEQLASCFIEPEDYTDEDGAKFVISSDGSFYASSINDRLPSIQVCYLKFSTLLIEMDDFEGLEDLETRMIDPFKVAALQRNRETLTLVLPISNFRRPEDDCMKTTFRRQMDAFLWSEATRHRPDDPSTSLMGTLIELAKLRPIRNAEPGQILIHKCPNIDCDEEEILIDPNDDEHSCDGCGKPLFVSDCLRLWEAVNDFHPNLEPASRFMGYVEHLLPIHYLRLLEEQALSRVSSLAILVDGPLAVFGQAAWLHQSIMRYLHQLRSRLGERNLEPPVIMGLQKSGYVVDHMRLLERYVPNNRIFSITDDFRYEYLGIERSGNGFGSETYYGHDFAFKSPSGKLFVISLPYPFPSKRASSDFPTEKAVLERYPELSRALHLLTKVETDLYRDALIPIALAHRYTAISLRPGGRVLDVMGRTAQNET